MVKVIRNPDGKFAGSIGAGKTKVPAPAVAPVRPARQPVGKEDPARVGDSARAFLKRMTEMDMEEESPRQSAQEVYDDVPLAERTKTSVEQMDQAFEVMKTLGEPSDDAYGFRSSLISIESYRGGNYFEWTNRSKGIRFGARLNYEGKIVDAKVWDHGHTRVDGKAFEKANIELEAIFPR